jgi:lipid-binding SYLF domain-containing protein
MITVTQKRLVARLQLVTSWRTAIMLLIVISMLALACAPASAQKAVSPLVAKNAAERSERAAKIIDTIMALPAAEGIPREVLEKAEAIAVIPKIVKVTVLFSTTTKGYGVVSRRVPGGWTLPAYYGFGGGKVGSLGGGEAKDLIIFFMNDKMVDYFQKGRFEFERERAANGGTVGVSIQKAVLDRANVFVYALDDGKLSGVEINNGFWSQLVLNPDNNINNTLYRMKGRDVLARKPVNAETVPAGVNAVQQALTRHSARQQ